MGRSLAGPGKARTLGEGKGGCCASPWGMAVGGGREEGPEVGRPVPSGNSEVEARAKEGEAGHQGPGAVFSEQGNSTTGRR